MPASNGMDCCITGDGNPLRMLKESAQSLPAVNTPFHEETLYIVKSSSTARNRND